MSRKFKRFLKQEGFEKSMDKFINNSVKRISKDLNPFQDYIFEHEGVEYDLEPLIVLIPAVINNMKKGTKHFKKDIHNFLVMNSKKNSDKKIYDVTPAVAVSDYISDIYSELAKVGLYSSTIKSIFLSKAFCLYDGDLGEININNLPDDLDESIYKNSGNVGELLLSHIYDSAINTYCFKAFNSDKVVEDFVALYVISNVFEYEGLQVNDFLAFSRILMEYFITKHQKKDIPIEFEITGDLKADVEKINPLLIDLLDILTVDNSEDFLELSLDELTSNEIIYLHLFEVAFKYSILDFSYKSLIYNREHSIKQLKEDLGNENKTYLREQRKLQKKISSLEKTILDKDKKITNLNNQLKVKTKEQEYLDKIAQLESKLKSTENKYLSATNRVKNLEAKLSNKELEEPKEDIVTEEIIGSKDIIKETTKEDLIEVSYEEKVAKLKDLNFFVVGGNTNFFGRLKAVLPNSRHIDILNEGCNFTVPKSVDCILNISKVTTHSHIKRAESQAGKDVPTIKLSTYQVSEIINIIYDILYKK